MAGQSIPNPGYAFCGIAWLCWHSSWRLSQHLYKSMISLAAFDRSLMFFIGWPRHIGSLMCQHPSSPQSTSMISFTHACKTWPECICFLECNMQNYAYATGFYFFCFKKTPFYCVWKNFEILCKNSGNPGFALTSWCWLQKSCSLWTFCRNRMMPSQTQQPPDCCVQCEPDVWYGWSASHESWDFERPWLWWRNAAATNPWGWHSKVAWLHLKNLRIFLEDSYLLGGEKGEKKETSYIIYIILLRKDFVKETPARLDFCLFVAHCNAVVVPRDLHSLFGIVVVCSWRCGTGLGPSRRFLGKYQGLLALFFVANFIVLFNVYVFHFPSQTNTK